ncbi:hypothetical protein QH494_26280 [Sphingomonas sp. AR_OL41]|uniref:hypothetical protein n=1 Tax=Sphingomonas sp. AR_OL41 TaxID=3042729 RepID=UPI00247FA840|nr:hypothetical protein [Sphingomonas sp. AR_OL41]MDH7975709.1 hypothetical protein [Sphingomonas sp. AR_OL41]
MRQMANMEKFFAIVKLLDRPGWSAPDDIAVKVPMTPLDWDDVAHSYFIEIKNGVYRLTRDGIVMKSFAEERDVRIAAQDAEMHKLARESEMLDIEAARMRHRYLMMKFAGQAVQ